MPFVKNDPCTPRMEINSITTNDTLLNFLIDSTVSLKVQIANKEGIGVRYLIHSTSGVKGRVGASRWGLGWVISGSIIHLNLHKPNNKLVSAWLEHFWSTDEPRAYMDSQNSPRLGLGESHQLPLAPKCHFVLRLPSWKSQNSRSRNSCNYESP
jgi:hypothetical protein